MTFETADDVLEHFGIRGMKWGHRKQRSSSSKYGSGTSKKKKVAIGAGIGLAVIGAATAAAVLHSRGSVPVSSISSSSSRNGFRAAIRVIKSSGDTRYDAIRGASRAGRITKDQSARLIRLNTRRMINEAERLARIQLG
jgi:hypothetical protein